MRENRGTTSNTKEDRAGEGRQGHVELREHPGLGGAAAGGAGLGGPLRGLVRSAGVVAEQSRSGLRQTVEGSFSAVSKPNFASKYTLESSRRDLHNALLCTALKSYFSKNCY